MHFPFCIILLILLDQQCSVHETISADDREWSRENKIEFPVSPVPTTLTSNICIQPNFAFLFL